ncbi:MAG TPA: SAM-dependent methyltransferase [Candidatus Xenobia bacterium]|jgi:SAM-dependent methyltransferase
MFARLRAAIRLLRLHLSGRPSTSQERFDLLFSALPDPWHFERSPFEHERLSRLFQSFGGRRFQRALEVGCAEGTFTGRLAEVADHVTGLDVSEVALARARTRHPSLTFVQHDLGSGPLAEPPFDLVVASEVLYFFEDPGLLHRVADALVQGLVPGGWLVLAHMRLLKDDTSGHARTWSGYPRMGAATVHPVFKSRADLRVLREDLYPLYAICVLERTSSG